MLFRSNRLTFTDADTNNHHEFDTDTPEAWKITWSEGKTNDALNSSQQYEDLKNYLSSALKLQLTGADGSEAGFVTWTFSAIDKYFDFLAKGEELKVYYEFTLKDNDGGSVTYPIIITVKGTNDLPVFGSMVITDAYTEDGGTRDTDNDGNQNNGFGNGDQSAPGNSGDNNGAENDNSSNGHRHVKLHERHHTSNNKVTKDSDNPIDSSKIGRAHV